MSRDKSQSGRGRGHSHCRSNEIDVAGGDAPKQQHTGERGMQIYVLRGLAQKKLLYGREGRSETYVQIEEKAEYNPCRAGVPHTEDTEGAVNR